MTKYNIEPYEDNYSKSDFRREEAYIRARKRVKELEGFYWHAAVYVVVNIFLIIVIGVNSGSFWHFGTFATPVFWGIGLFFHYMSVFGKELFFGKNWEERKIREYMDKEKEEQRKYE